MTKLQPFYHEVQAHYDLSDEFFALFLDPTRTYSCAYFSRDDMSLEEAQIAKIDLSLGKCDLHPGQTLLDIGCGWGTTALRAAENYGVKAIGLTLSKNQQSFASQRVLQLDGPVDVEFRLQGWEEFQGSVDRIVSIGAFEHFRNKRHRDFFSKCHHLLPDDGKMLLHTIVLNSYASLKELRLEVTEESLAFAKFILSEIFPGGQICTPERIKAFATDAGFKIQQVQPLRLHYARTLDCWAESLAQAREAAIELTSLEVYERYRKYLTGCADSFRQGYIDVVQFTLSCN